MKEYKTSKRFISFHMPLAIMVLSLILCILDGEIDIISLVLLFIIFTYFPPKIPLFLDPLTKTYGLIKK